jgi:hypothetical protein
MSLGLPSRHGLFRWRDRGDGQPEPKTRVLSLCWAGFALLSAISVLLVFWAYVPLNMDEFVAYQTLAALSHPHSNENILCFPNSSFYLQVLGRFTLPLLTYDYIGSLSSLLYAPFFLAWPSPMSARLTGVLALLIQALVLARMFRLRTAVVFCCLLFFFPYSFAHIADTGPVAFQTTSVFIVCYLLHCWILSRHPRRRAGMMVVAGLMVGLGCWVKPTYFFVSAGLAITALAGFFLALVERPGERLARTAEYLLLVVCAAVPTLLIYEARHVDDSPYLPVLAGQFVSSQVHLADIGQRFHDNVFHFLINPLDATSPYYDVRPELPVYAVLTCLLAGGLILGGVSTRGISPRHRFEILLNYGLFILALLLVASNLFAKSMHHAVLAYPFLLLAIARGMQLQRSRIFLPATLGLFLVLNASLFMELPSLLEKSRRMSATKSFVAELNGELNRNLAPDAVIVCVDWGIYFVQTLYGPRSQVVMYLCPAEDLGQLARAAAVARRMHRQLAVVGLQDNQRVKDRLHAGYAEITGRHGPGEGSPWMIWQIPYEKLGGLDSVADNSRLP